jgi:hypothetical protein
MTPPEFYQQNSQRLRHQLEKGDCISCGIVDRLARLGGIGLCDGHFIPRSVPTRRCSP